jgi:hypothetical protein
MDAMAGGSGARTPLHGGLAPTGALGGGLVEIACDESGFSGTNLLDPATPVITHASVDLTAGEAVEVIAELRAGFRLSPRELKSGRFLRGSGAALPWLLTALAGRARVHLVDKEFFLATRIVDLLLAEPSYTAGTRLSGEQRAAASALYRGGRAAGEPWRELLAAFVDLVRLKHRLPAGPAAQRFFHARDALAAHRTSALVEELTDERVRALLHRLDENDRSVPPPLEPLLPAHAETVLTWSDGRTRVLVTHDEQSALTADRLARLQQTLATAAPVSPLAGLLMADSRDDPRVQVADLLAGAARREPGLVGEALLTPHPLRDTG